jgi:DNA-binding transcriptional regulator YiaG
MSKSDGIHEVLLRTTIIGQVLRTLKIRATLGTGTHTTATSTTTIRAIRTKFDVSTSTSFSPAPYL